jgi:phosphotransferase system HPr (HPr) family protein
MRRALLVPVIAANPDAFAIASKTTGGPVHSGETVPVLRSLQAEPAETPQPVPPAAEAHQVRRDIIVRAEGGIHTRPAGLVTQAVRVPREVSLQGRGRTVSARGSVGIMGLGTQAGDKLTIIAPTRMPRRRWMRSPSCWRASPRRCLGRPRPR